MSNANQLLVSPSLGSNSGSFRGSVHSYSSQQHHTQRQHQHSHSMSDMTPNYPSSNQQSAPRGHPHSRSHSQAPQTQTPQSAPLESLQYSQHQDQTTLVFGVLNYLERLEREISDMREFVNLGFRQLDGMEEHEGGLAARVEKYVFLLISHSICHTSICLKRVFTRVRRQVMEHRSLSSVTTVCIQSLYPGPE